MRWVEHLARMGEMRHAHKISDGKPEGTRSVRIRSLGWQDNIKMDMY
jgi:hypothetical protein